MTRPRCPDMLPAPSPCQHSITVSTTTPPRPPHLHHADDAKCVRPRVAKDTSGKRMPEGRHDVAEEAVL